MPFEFLSVGRMEFHKIALSGNYPADYGAVARALGSHRLRPSENELAFVAGLGTGWYHSVGSLSPQDLGFLSAVAGAVGAARALEIGTASGVSAAVIAAAMARGFEERGEPLPPVLLDTIDRKDRCLFDDGKPIGFRLGEIVPDLASRVRLHTDADATAAKDFIGPRELSFAFIDGNHQHPWPLIDVLCLWPLMRPGAWMVMHDIDYPAHSEAARVRLGARHVFRAWPGAKIDGGSIGAVQLPTTRRTLALAVFVETLLRHPFETSEGSRRRYRRLVEDLATHASGRAWELLPWRYARFARRAAFLLAGSPAS